MKKVKFANHIIKEEYESILKNHPALFNVLKFEFQLKKKQIKIEEIIKDIYCVSIVVNDHDKLIIVTIDFIKNEIRVKDEKSLYVKIYDNYPENSIIPKSYEYQKNKRVIRRKISPELSSNYSNKYALVIHEDNVQYGITIISGTVNFDINDFISKLLDYDGTIENIKELLLIISKLIDLVYFDLKLSDNVGNLIKISYNMLTDYVEYHVSQTENDKIFLKNNEFIIERHIKEKYNDDITPLMKKIGVYNGKEKRKN